MHTPRLERGDLVACAGAVLLVVSLFLPWYEIRLDIAEFSLSDTGTGREALGPIFGILLGVAALAIAVVAARAARVVPHDVPASALLLVLGLFAVLVVLYRLVDIPVDGDVPDGMELSRQIGVFIALLGAATVAFGGWRATTGEGVQNDRRRPEGEGRRRWLELRGRA